MGFFDDSDFYVSSKWELDSLGSLHLGIGITANILIMALKSNETNTIYYYWLSGPGVCPEIVDVGYSYIKWYSYGSRIWTKNAGDIVQPKDFCGTVLQGSFGAFVGSASALIFRPATIGFIDNIVPHSFAAIVGFEATLFGFGGAILSVSDKFSKNIDRLKSLNNPNVLPQYP